MGIIIESKTFTIERRYQGISISKNLDTNELVVTITVVEGFYDGNDRWNTTNTYNTYISGDAVLYIMGMKPSNLGLKTTAIGETLNTLVYAILQGSIQLDATLTISAKDPDGKAVSGYALLKKGDIIYGQTPVPGLIRTPLLLGATLEVHADGYQPFTKTYPVLQGNITEEVTLTPVPPPTTEGTPTTGDAAA